MSQSDKFMVLTRTGKTITTIHMNQRETVAVSEPLGGDVISPIIVDLETAKIIAELTHGVIYVLHSTSAGPLMASPWEE